MQLASLRTHEAPIALRHILSNVLPYIVILPYYILFCFVCQWIYKIFLILHKFGGYFLFCLPIKRGAFGACIRPYAVLINVAPLIGKLEEGFQRHCLACVFGIADADGDRMLSATAELGNGLLDIMLQLLNLRGVGCLKHGGKLVTGVSGEEEIGVVLKSNLLKLECDGAKNLVALVMAVTVVDQLQLIYVHHDEEEPVISSLACGITSDLIGQVTVKGVSVVKSGKGIVGDLLVLESDEHDEHTGGHAETVEGKLTVRENLERAEHKGQDAEPEYAVSHTAAAQCLYTEVKDQRADNYEDEGDVLKSRADPVIFTSNVIVIIGYIVEKSGRNINQ